MSPKRGAFAGPGPARGSLGRVRGSWTRDERLLPGLLAALIGLAGFGASAWTQAGFGLFSRLGPVASLAGALLIEESIRFAWCLGFALLARRRAYPDLALLGVLAAAVFAACENLAFFVASPDSGIWARLAWSTPTHLNTALMATLALAPLARGSACGLGRHATRLALAFALALGWHGAYNAVAMAGPGAAALVLGGGANVAAFLVLLDRASAILGASSLLDEPSPGAQPERGSPAQTDKTPASFSSDAAGATPAFSPDRQGDPHGNA